MAKTAVQDMTLYLGTPRFASGVRLAQLGFVATPSKAPWGKRPLPGVLFVLCQRGSLTCAVPDRPPASCRAGDLFVAFPGRRLTLSPTSKNARFAYLELQGSQAVLSVLGLGYGHAFCAPTAGTDWLDSLVPTVESCPLPGRDAQVLARLEQTLGDVWQDCLARSPVPAFFSALRAIHNLPPNALTTEKVAAALNISRASLNQLFLKGCGLRPGAYLAGLKAEIVRALLGNDLLTVSQIAARTGFSSAAALACFFRRQVGTTPHAYRKSGEQWADFERTTAT